MPRAASAGLTALFAPASVAIIGASPESGRGRAFHEHLLRFGYPGKIFPVNPRHKEIRGLRCYPSLTEVPGQVECIAVAVGAKRAVAAVQEAAQLGVGAAIVIASGFAEAGEDGRRLQDDLREVAQAAGMVMCGPNCYGTADFHGGFAGYSGPLPVGLGRGNVSLLLQSGALTHAILNPASMRGLGLSYLVTAGNEAVTTLSDYLAHVALDSHTSVIGCFLETLRDREGFLAALRLARDRGKDVVVVKTGRSAAAQRAAFAHTGAITGDDRVFDAICDRYGAIRVADLDEFIECLLLLSRDRRFSNAPVALASISGGGSGVMADLSEETGLELASLTTDSSSKLSAVLPPFASPHNPLDLTGAVGEQPELVDAAVGVLAAAPEIGAIGLALNASTADTSHEVRLYIDMLSRAARAVKSSGTPFLAFSMTSGPFHPDLLAAAEHDDVPLLQGMRETLAVLARIARARGRQSLSTLPPSAPLNAIAEQFPDGLVLSEHEAKQLIARVGIPSPREQLVSDSEKAVAAATGIGFPVVLKIDSPDIPHKTEVGCVQTGITHEGELRVAFDRIVGNARRARPGARIRGVLVAETAPQGVDVLVGGVTADGIPAVALGIGGTFAELGGVPAVRLAPPSLAEARSMLAEFPGARLLDGYRGADPADKDALAAALVAIGTLIWQFRGQLSELDVNPLRVLPRGHGVLALDALMVPLRRTGDPWGSKL